MNEWYVVTSKTGYDSEGFPCGQILCRKKEDITDAIKKNNIDEPLIMDYKHAIANLEKRAE